MAQSRSMPAARAHSKISAASGAETVGKPGIGREIGMRRYQSRVVVGRFRVEIVAARRLDQDGEIADAEAGDREIAASEPAGMKERVALGRVPLRRDALLHRG